MLRRWLSSRLDDAESFGFRYRGRVYRFPCPQRPDRLIEGLRRRRQFYELELLETLRDEVGNQPGLVLDVGANVGNHTVFFASVMKRKVLAFEPVPANREVLGQVLNMNAVAEDVWVEPCAVGDTTGTVRMTSPDERNPGMFRVTETDKGIEAPVVRLDDILPERLKQIGASAVALIKIDVEGHEAAVLRGARETLAKHKPIVTTELPTVAAYDACCALLAEAGLAPRHLRCVTPTVVFLPEVRTGPGYTDAIRRGIADFQRRHPEAEA